MTSIITHFIADDSTQGGSFFNGQFSEISKNPSGAPMLKWTNEVPNDGLIYYNYLLNAERLLITTPKALSEVLVHKNYDFIKPSLMRNGLGRILGVGILLAEGEEHKVRVFVDRVEFVANERPDPTQEPLASFRISSH